ncbi:hypothetical protein GPECTOR_1987g1014 [Gonium pectorale]|uniref:CTLH/CRA C-terminal to LisH motif domain-containing protein n=1 Tax=Gonium pectorale TaxID=33097 RepID=A0A150FTD1_GONPE|nr:hypothetical protein GPECTOR_1987g1014 [Gonium pectorale]|eukprot:KXZ40838.1 hypothetical protein GPECTOR_1987g1014 [Gonium pectorale]
MCGGDEAPGRPRVRGEEVLAKLLRLAQSGDVPGVLALVEAADPGLWSEHPGLLFDVRRCQYGALLAEGRLAEALQLARSELTPLADAHPSLLPALKSAMAALLPSPLSLPAQQLPNGGGDAGGGGGAGGSSGGELLPSLRSVAGAIQAALQPRLGLQGPRLVLLMEDAGVGPSP